MCLAILDKKSVRHGGNFVEDLSLLNLIILFIFKYKKKCGEEIEKYDQWKEHYLQMSSYKREYLRYVKDKIIHEKQYVCFPTWLDGIAMSDTESDSN